MKLCKILQLYKLNAVEYLLIQTRKYLIDETFDSAIFWANLDILY